MVSGKRSSGAIRSVHARRKADYQETRVSCTKRRNRAAIVVRVSTVDVVQEVRKTRTGATILVKNCQIHASVLHMANDRPAEAPGSNQTCAGHEFFQFLLDLFLVVCLGLALRRANRCP